MHMGSKGEYPVVFIHHGDDLIVFFRGSITANHSYALYHRLEEWLSEKPVSKVFLDLHEATYIDSTTVGTLIKIQKFQQARAASCVLTNLSDPIREILGQMKLLDYFTVAEDREVAELEDEVVRQIPLEQRDKVSSDFILDAHHDIVNLVPELREEFETLFKALEQSAEKE